MKRDKGFVNLIEKAVPAAVLCLASLCLAGCELPGFLYDAKCFVNDIVDDVNYLLSDEEEYEPVVIADSGRKDAKNDVSVGDPDTEVTEEVIQLEDADPGDMGDEASSAEDAALEELLKDERYYAYHTLSDGERKIYRLLYNSFFDFGKKVNMPTRNPEMIDKAFDCLLADNPELFYVKGYNLIKYERGGVVEQLAVSGMYTMTQSDAKIHRERADQYVDACLAGMPATADDYEKIKYLYEYIIKNTEYDLAAPNGQNFLSVFEGRRSVCQGYSTAMQYMMNRLGLFCTVVRGITHGSERHAWNLVKADGDYYYVDVTWGDMSYELTADNDMSALPVSPEISYDYLCVTTAELSKTHTIDSAFPVPECVSMNDYYYVREGNYFTAVDDERLWSVFSKGYDNGDAMVTVKCSDESVYSDMSSYLTEDGRIFDYLRGSKNVNYVTLPNLNELIFYL
ncbi:MAG: hypothetical protein K6E63_10845 [Lachnospiraceae bacterium]|nr:hypothetical protein [Lachnospiraceae bacterium]